ncbi:hypothetical protein EV122DRAFT_266193 [Schizophyllum commune]
MATETENWDDDFEFGGQKTSRELDRDGATPEGIKEDRSRATHVSHGDGEGENWDADFEDEPMGSQEPARFPQTIPDTISNSVQSSPKRPREEDYDSEDDDEAEFGAHGEEEDKTVTARSRRPLAQERPPVPEIPREMLSLQIPHLPSAYSADAPQPHPRSPTASVFSVPAPSIQSSADSTAHMLGRTVSGDSRFDRSHPHVRSGHRLENLPPSPPIHKERERRRLRKKSRPTPVNEINAAGPSSQSSEYPFARSSEDAHMQLDEGDIFTDPPTRPSMRTRTPSHSSSRPRTPNERPRTSSRTSSRPPSTTSSRPRTPSHASRVRTPPNAMPVPLHKKASQAAIGVPQMPQTPPSSVGSPTGGSLLSRMSSVKKKWDAARRSKRGSVTPSEVADVTGQDDRRRSIDSRRSMSEDESRRGSIDSRASHERHRRRQSVDPAMLAGGSRKTHRKAGKSMDWRLGMRKHRAVRDVVTSDDGLSMDEDDNEQTPRPQSTTSIDFEGLPPIPPVPAIQYDFDASKYGHHNNSCSSLGSSMSSPQMRRASLNPSPTPHGRHHSRSPTPLSRGSSPVPPLPPQPESSSDGKDKDKAPAKLVKRKSMGFVQLRKSTRPLNSSVEDVAEDSAGEGPSGSQGELDTPVAPTRMSNFVRRISFGSKGPAPGGVANLLNTAPKQHKRTKSGGLLPPVELHTPPLPSPLGLSPVEPSPLSTPRGPQAVRGAASRPAGSTTANRAVGSGSIHSSLGRASPFSSPYASGGSGFGSGRGEHSGSSGRPGTQLIQAYSATGLSHTVSDAGTSRPSANMRRNSLSDLNMRRNTSSGGGLRIPARISQAQQGLRRDLGLVREFAGSVNEIRELRDTYNVLVSRVSGMLDEMRLEEPLAQPPAASPTKVEPSPTEASKSGRPSQDSKRKSKDSRRESIDRRRSKDGTPTTPVKSRTPRSPFGRRSRSGTASSSNAPSLPSSSSQPSSSQPSSSANSSITPSSDVSTPITSPLPPGTDPTTPLAKFSSRFASINNRYMLAWECADLLIELGGGAPPAVAGVAVSPSTETHPKPTRDASDQTVTSATTSSTSDMLPPPPKTTRDRGDSEPGTRSHLEKSTSAPAQVGRTRAITLTDGESPMVGPGEGPTLPSSASGGRASTVGRGGGDLTQRQLTLLRDMLTSPTTHLQQRHRTVVPHDPSAHQHGKREANDPAVNREWTWDNYTIGGPAGQPSTARDDAAGLASASSLALPPEVTFETNPEVRRKRASRIGGLGMAGLRDMLRALKRGTVDPALAGESSSSLSTMASQPAQSQPGIRKRASRNATLNAAGLPTPKGTMSTASGITVGRRRAKTSTGPPESINSSGRDTPYSRSETPYNHSENHATASRTHFEVPATPSKSSRDPYVHSNSSKITSKFSFHGNPSSLGVSGGGKSSPRRPSLASIFRIGGKSEKNEGREEAQESSGKPSKSALKEGAKSPRGSRLRVKRRPKNKDVPLPLPGSGSGSASPALGSSGAEDDYDRNGNRSASTSAHGSGHGVEGSSSTVDDDEDEDWDRMDVDFDMPTADSRVSLGMGQPSTSVGASLVSLRSDPFLIASAGLNSPHSSAERPHKASSGAETVRASHNPERGRSPYSQMSPRAMVRSSSGRSVSGPSAPGSSSSLFDRPTRLSNVEEDHAKGEDIRERKGSDRESPIDRRGPPLRIVPTHKNGSVRSMPAGPGPWNTGTFSPEPGASWKVEDPIDPLQPLPDPPRLAMTPENIKPLLENSREIKLRLADCIEEVRELLAGKEFKELRKAASGDMVGVAV